MHTETQYQVHHHSLVHHVIQALFLFVIYNIVGEFGYLFVFYPEPAAHFWPVSGVTLAVLLRIPKQSWLPYLIAIFLGEVTLTLRQGLPFNVAMAWGLADTLEPFLAAFSICLILKQPIDLTRTKHLGVFLMCCILTPMVGAVIAAFASITWLGAPSFIGTSRTWWFAISLGEILVTPFILIWINRRTLNFIKSHLGEGLLLIGLFLSITFLTFATHVTNPSEYLTRNLFMFLMLPLFMWTILRFEEYLVYTVLLLVNMVAAYFTARGKGPFAYLLISPLARLVSLQTYLSFVSFSTMALTTFIKQRRRIEDQLHSIIENSSALIYVKDLQGKYLLINKGYEKNLKTTREKMIGKTDFELFPREDALRYQANDKRVLKEGMSIEFEEETTTSNYISIKFPLCDVNKEPYAVGGISTDITPMKRAEEELKNAIQLRDDFIAIASHELRTPLTPLKLQIGILRRYISKFFPDLKDSEELLRLINRSDSEVNQITSLVENLLDVSNMTQNKLSLKRSEIDLIKLVHKVIERLQPDIQKSLCQVSILSPDHLKGEWDEFRIEQVITNLVSNAIKYGDCKPIEIKLEHNEAFARMIIKDNGIGIPKESISKIFERFERAVPVTAFGGLGLGLFIVERIVKAHGGHIKVQSEEGSGSVFTVDLPIHPLPNGHLS